MTDCVKCGVEPETLDHVVLECNRPWFGNDALLERLGLTNEINHAAVRETKKLLKIWENETRTIR